MKISKILIPVLMIGLFISSCGNDDPKMVNVKLQLKVGQDALVHETTYKVNGYDVQFTNVAFYLGDMTFETSDGLTYESSSRYHLVKPGIFDFNFDPSSEENIEDLSLSKVSFFVGVDSDTNAETEMDFTERAVGDPLGQQNPTMHWGWAGGYRFLNIDANADLDGDGEFETQLTYHLGKNQFLKNISLSPDQKIEGGSNDFEINFDIATFLSNIDFTTETFTKAQPDNIGIADKLLNNYSAAFTFSK